MMLIRSKDTSPRRGIGSASDAVRVSARCSAALHVPQDYEKQDQACEFNASQDQAKKRAHGCSYAAAVAV